MSRSVPASAAAVGADSVLAEGDYATVARLEGAPYPASCLVPLVAAGVLSACAVGPDFEPAPAPAPVDPNAPPADPNAPAPAPAPAPGGGE